MIIFAADLYLQQMKHQNMQITLPPFFPKKSLSENMCI
jgi:hypothetical protein